MTSLVKRHRDGAPGSGRSPIEARTLSRVATRASARITLAGQGELECKLRDIGDGGACLQTLSPFASSAVRRLEINLTDGPLMVDVEGLWQREAVIEKAVLTGVRFVDLGDEPRNRLRRFVEQCATEFTEFLQNRCEAEFNSDEAHDLALSSRLREAQAGTWICSAEGTREGEDSVFIVLRGAVSLRANSAREGDLVVERVTAGGFFGGVPLIAGVTQPFSVVVEHEATLLEVDRDAFAFIERAKPLLARRLTRMIVARLVEHMRVLAAHLGEARRKIPN